MLTMLVTGSGTGGLHLLTSYAVRRDPAHDPLRDLGPGRRTSDAAVLLTRAGASPGELDLLEIVESRKRDGGSSGSDP